MAKVLPFMNYRKLDHSCKGQNINTLTIALFLARAGEIPKHGVGMLNRGFCVYHLIMAITYLVAHNNMSWTLIKTKVIIETSMEVNDHLQKLCGVRIISTFTGHNSRRDVSRRMSNSITYLWHSYSCVSDNGDISLGHNDTRFSRIHT